MHTQQHINSANDEIDLRELFRAIWAGKWTIILTTFVFTVGAVLYALKLPDIYRSEVTLAAVEEGGIKMPAQLGSLAALAGVNLGSKGNDTVTLALEVLKSRDFLVRFIEENNLLIEIMAIKGWDRNTDQLLIDSNVYDENRQQWVREVKAPFQAKPSKLEAYDAFQKLFSIEQDKVSGMIKLSIEHYSPLIAKSWIDKLVIAINEEMRKRELRQAEKSIAYLNAQIAQTNVADVRGMLFSLIEEQTKTVMLANVRDEYVFETIDPAVVAESKTKPKRAIIVIISVFLAVMLSIFIVLLTALKRKQSEK